MSSTSSFVCLLLSIESDQLRMNTDFIVIHRKRKKKSILGPLLFIILFIWHLIFVLYSKTSLISAQFTYLKCIFILVLTAHNCHNKKERKVLIEIDIDMDGGESILVFTEEALNCWKQCSYYPKNPSHNLNLQSPFVIN